MMSGRRGPTRRAVLLGAVAAVATACRPRRSAPAAAAPADLAALRSAISAEETLQATYDAVVAAAPRSERARLHAQKSTHAAHLDALRTLLPVGTPSAAATVTPAAVGSDRAALRRALADSGSGLTDAALTAIDGQVAATLAAVGAVHLEQGGQR
jgi:hypothetical protein